MTLQAALTELRAQGQLTPCAGRADRWDSEDPAVRAAAAWECTQCPIVAVCRNEAKVEPYATGVWGGIDRSPLRLGPGRGRYAFTPQEEAVMDAVARSGATFAEIAEMVGASRSAVSRWVRENVSAEQRRSQGKRSHAVHPWVDQAVRLREERGLSFLDIADALGVPASTVRYAYHQAKKQAVS